MYTEGNHQEHYAAWKAARAALVAHKAAYPEAGNYKTAEAYHAARQAFTDGQRLLQQVCDMHKPTLKGKQGKSKPAF